ncbi:MAG: hypothetical protein CMQ29_03585 [Gammaproteobacteria bacterium]|nr:hypothetical protein [Gammaproteobacteria bacterium]
MPNRWRKCDSISNFPNGDTVGISTGEFGEQTVDLAWIVPSEALSKRVNQRGQGEIVTLVTSLT